MSVLYCHVEQFLYRVTCQAQPALSGRPVALLGPDDKVAAVSPEAAATGLAPGMRPQEVRTRCPDAGLYPLDLQVVYSAALGLRQALRGLELPLEVAGWGSAYLDLRPVTRQKDEVALLAAELGRTVRRQLGAALQPALGWDSGKFTARAAALRTQPGRMRLIAVDEEQHFLAPLPLSLLPLPPDTLQQLTWLGIRTLGEFAALPGTAVWQRFGPAGKLAQQWARGQDSRPVCAGPLSNAVTTQLECDPPTEQLPPVLAVLRACLGAGHSRSSSPCGCARGCRS